MVISVLRILICRLTRNSLISLFLIFCHQSEITFNARQHL